MVLGIGKIWLLKRFRGIGSCNWQFQTAAVNHRTNTHRRQSPNVPSVYCQAPDRPCARGDGFLPISMDGWERWYLYKLGDVQIMNILQIVFWLSVLSPPPKNNSIQ